MYLSVVHGCNCRLCVTSSQPSATFQLWEAAGLDPPFLHSPTPPPKKTRVPAASLVGWRPDIPSKQGTPASLLNPATRGADLARRPATQYLFTDFTTTAPGKAGMPTDFESTN
jgi:hypothetical protein